MRSPSKTPRRSFRERKPPRQHSADVLDPDNQTDPVAGQEAWSIDNLPDILYQFRPASSQPQIRRDLNIPTKPSPWRDSPALRCFALLPDRVSSNVEEFRVEAWMRLDRRIQLHDITDRMNPRFRVENNALQQRGVRFRKAFNLLAWGTGNRKTEQMAKLLEQKMRDAGIDPRRNSTRGLTPGLVDVLAGEAGGRIPVPEPYRSRYPSQIDCGPGVVAAAGRAEYARARRIPLRAKPATQLCGSSSGSSDAGALDAARLSAATRAAAQLSFLSDASDFALERYDDDVGAFEYDPHAHHHRQRAHPSRLGYHERYPLLPPSHGYPLRDGPFDHELDFAATPPDALSFGGFHGLADLPLSAPSSQQQPPLLPPASTPDVGSSFSSETPSAASDEEPLWLQCSAYVHDMGLPPPPHAHHLLFTDGTPQHHHAHHNSLGGGGGIAPSDPAADQKIPLGAETICWDRIGPDSPPPAQPSWPFVEGALGALQAAGLPCMDGGRWADAPSQQQAQLGGKEALEMQRRRAQGLTQAQRCAAELGGDIVPF